MSKKEPFIIRAKRVFGSPGELTDVIVLSGSRRAVVRGCKKILSYALEEIVIVQSKQTVRLSGSDLRCVSFAAGSTTVEGRIRSIRLEQKPQKEERS